MNPTSHSNPREHEESFTEEVRRIRRGISLHYGNDVDRLCDHLREVEQDYAARRGMFSGLSREGAARVVEAWGKDAHSLDDPVVDDVRSIRRKLHNE